jgi:Ca2+-transporting ATPase
MPADQSMRARRTLTQQLRSSFSGLTSAEAAGRLEQHGPNELKESKGVSLLHILLAQFNSLIVWILIVAGIISGVLGEVVDAMAIIAIVALNATIGFYQEYSAEKSIAALRKMTAPRAKVRRDGRIAVVAASEVVPGDVLELEAGDLVAADARLIEAVSMRCVESALTGESEAVDKQAVTLDRCDVPLGDRGNMLFMGTSVAAGQGKAVIVATAMNTEIGRIAGLIQEAAADSGTPLRKRSTRPHGLVGGHFRRPAS